MLVGRNEKEWHLFCEPHRMAFKNKGAFFKNDGLFQKKTTDISSKMTDIFSPSSERKKEEIERMESWKGMKKEKSHSIFL